MTRKVLISVGFGAGWSTWVGLEPEHKRFALFDERLIAAVESGKPLGSESDPETPLGDFALRFRKAFPLVRSLYLGGAANLRVVEVEGPFIVEEYDGAESVLLRDGTEWF